MIEAVNGRLKQSFRALEATPNTMIFHITDDYRIAASLINCFFARFVSDIDDGKEIANDMLKKVNIKNDMEHYLKDNNNKLWKSMVKIDVMDLNDFPRLERETIKQKITFGNYQLNQSYGYLAEHQDENGIYHIFICDKIDEKEKNVIDAKIKSRHSNSIEYQLCIRFVPNSNDVNDLSWICNCLPGRRTCGCCSHVACIIYYLSCGKYEEEPLRKPGKSLESCLMSYPDEDDDLNKLVNIQDDEIDASLSNGVKRSLSVYSQTELITDASPITPSQSSRSCSQRSKKLCSQSLQNNIKARDLTNHLPEWGGKISVFEIDYEIASDYDRCRGFNNIPIQNTCTIDYFLLAFWVSFKLSNSFAKLMSSNQSKYKIIQTIIDLIEMNEWDRAKTLWVLIILKLTPDNWEISTFGTQYNMFVQPIKDLQVLYFTCNQCQVEVIRPRNDFQLSKIGNECQLNSSVVEDCQNCKTMVNGRFKNDCFVLLVEVLSDLDENKIQVNEIPERLHIDGHNFNFLCCSIEVINHFQSIFSLNGSFYLIDDLKGKKMNNRIPADHKISFCFYYLS